MEITPDKIGTLSSEAREFILNSGMAARYNFWANMPTWTELEAVALVLGIDPQMMKQTLPQRMYLPIGVPLREVRQLVARAVNAYELYTPISPYEFLVWAKSRSIYVPQELERLIPVPENKKVTPHKVIEKSLGTRERETLLKLVIGMAVSGYGYDPAAAKNSAIAEITSDLEVLGIAISDDTVRKKLEEAKEFLPQEPQKS